MKSDANTEPYWYEKQIHIETQHQKALNHLRLLCQSLILKNYGPLCTIGRIGRSDLYLIIINLSLGMKNEQSWSPGSWQAITQDIIKHIAVELVNDKKFESEKSFYQALHLAMGMFEFSPKLPHFIVKVKELYEASLKK